MSGLRAMETKSSSSCGVKLVAARPAPSTSTCHVCECAYHVSVTFFIYICLVRISRRLDDDDTYKTSPPTFHPPSQTHLDPDRLDVSGLDGAAPAAPRRRREGGEDADN